ncbi:uncharacterized protein LOC103162709 isoform X2 [Cricetulus griseus]|uniref:Uncharacterized protein LOC103162709 isoform X2 n=1 Tax=Cricetulus griseus TaxID=10029 RepID=A0A9J7JCJ1_CRIGR|nr:uncharacterized protein LOC103162709 isoform X2 [Cricetulus griseus]
MVPVMMDEARSYLEKRQKQDDGSQDQTSKDQSEPVWVPERLTRRVPASEDGENHKQTNVPDADNHDGDADPQDDSRTPMGDSVGVPETTANQTFCSSFP